MHNGALTGETGWPALPVTTRIVALPAGAENVAISLRAESWAALPGRFALPPVQPMQPARSDGGREAGNGADDRASRGLTRPILPDGLDPFLEPEPRVSLDPAVAKAGMIRLAAASLASVSSVGGATVAGVRIAPVRYAPATGQVEFLASAQLVVAFDSPKTATTGGSYRSPQAAGADLKRLLTLVDNPTDVRVDLERPEAFDTQLPDIDVLSPERTRARKESGKVSLYPVVDRDRVFIPPDIEFWPLIEDWPYVIVTDDIRRAEDGTAGGSAGSLVLEFERLAQWKTRKGLPARVVTVSDIMANHFGRHWEAGVTRDVPEAIRNFLKWAYQHWQMRWCLLGGDIDIVPTRHVLGNWQGDVSLSTETLPPAGSAYRLNPTTLRYHTPFTLATSDVLFAKETGEVIRHRDGATATSPGWYFTDSTYESPSSSETNFVVARAASTLLDRSFVLPQYGNMLPTDLYYSSLVSPLYSQAGKHDWDLDGNGIYGWFDWGNPDGVDFVSDIAVGRAPARETQHVRDFVDKVLSYELFVDARTGERLGLEYPRRITAVGDVWGSNWWDGSFDRIRTGGLDGACADKEQVIDQLRSWGVKADRVRRVYADIFFVPRIMSNLSVLDGAHLAELRAAINEGPHLVTVSGHGWYDGCAGFSSTGTSGANVSSLVNWPHHGIYFVDSCYTNEFDVDLWTAYNRTGGASAGHASNVCLGKNIVRSALGGAVAYVGYCRVGGVGASQELLFWEALGLWGQNHLGLMLNRARDIGKDRVMKWQIYDMNLIGDPELPVWTDSPTVVSVSHAGHIYGQDRLTVSVFHQAEPVLNASVCVSQLGSGPLDKVLFPLVQATEGHYTFDTSGAVDGTVTIVVTAKNTVPYVGTAEKVSNPVSPAKYRTRGFIYDVGRRDSSGVYAASADGHLNGLSPTLTAAWSINFGAAVVDVDRATDGTLLAGADTATGTNLRLVSAGGSILRSWSTGARVTSVALDHDRSRAFAGLAGGGVAAWNTSTGASAWTTAMEHCSYVDVDSAGNVYAAGNVDGGGRILKLNGATGTIIWSYTIGTSWEWTPRSFLLDADGTTYVGTAERELHKVTPSGTRAWKLPMTSPDARFGSVAVSLARYGTSLMAGFGDGTITAINGDGTQAWSVDLGDRIEAIAVGGAEIYIGCWHGVVALGSDGTQHWFRETTGAVLALALVGGRLYAGSRDGWVYQIDIPTGPTVVGIDVAGLIAGRLGRPPIIPVSKLIEMLKPIPPEPDPIRMESLRSAG